MRHGPVQQLVDNAATQSFDRLQFLFVQVGVAQFARALLELLFAKVVGAFLELIDGGNGTETFPPANEIRRFLPQQGFGFEHFALAHGRVFGHDGFQIVHIVGSHVGELWESR